VDANSKPDTAFLKSLMGPLEVSRDRIESELRFPWFPRNGPILAAAFVAAAAGAVTARYWWILPLVLLGAFMAANGVYLKKMKEAGPILRSEVLAVELGHKGRYLVVRFRRDGQPMVFRYIFQSEEERDAALHVLSARGYPLGPNEHSSLKSLVG